MKLSARKKHSAWDNWGYHSGRHKNVYVEVTELTDRSSHGEGYYFSLDSGKYNKTGEPKPFKHYNSLRFGKKFATKEEARDAAIKWIDEKLEDIQ